jgi:hypothetical protein
MACSLQTDFFNGASMTTPWSPMVTVKEVLATIEVSGWKFYGVLVENRDPQFWDWLDTECLLWAFDDGQSLRLWQDPQPKPLKSVEQPANEIEKIIGHHQSSKGDHYVAVKWKDRISPTWEMEQDLDSYADIITDYFMNCLKFD